MTIFVCLRMAAVMADSSLIPRSLSSCASMASTLESVGSFRDSPDQKKLVGSDGAWFAGLLVCWLFEQVGVRSCAYKDNQGVFGTVVQFIGQ